MRSKKLEPKTNQTSVAAFLKQAEALSVQSNHVQASIVFAMDATASREPTWDHACQLQADMFQHTTKLGGLQLQLCYYRGYQEFIHSPWLQDAQQLSQSMTAVHCLGGHTQISKVLAHTLACCTHKRISALVFVGDCIEEPLDQLCDLAGQLGLHQTPVFIFHEGSDVKAETGFRQIAQLSHGAYHPFDLNSGARLADLLSAVAVYATGGIKALKDFSQKHPATAGLLSQLSENR